jgi:hypothetical protein
MESVARASSSASLVFPRAADPDQRDVACVGHQGADRRDFSVAADEARQWEWKAGDRWAASRGWGHVLAKDRRLQVAELRSGLDSELLDERAPGPVVRRQRIRLTPRAVQGKHQVAPQALAERVEGEDAFELVHELRRPADLEVGVDSQFERVEAQLLQKRDLRQERVVRKSGEGPATPQSER